jgi:hypothetical protein
VRVRRPSAERDYSLSLGCAFALVAVVVLLLVWLLGQSFGPDDRGLPATSAPAVAPVAPVDPLLPTPTRDLPVVMATMAPPPAITATTMVVVLVVPGTATPTPLVAPTPTPIGTPPPLIAVTRIARP